MAQTVCIYTESKEKIDFKKISSFVQDNFGFALKVIKLKERIIQTKGLLYEPVHTQKLFEKIESNADKLGYADLCGHVDVIITDKLIATYEDTDQRLHLRAAVFGFPSVISLSGIVEAPAKPREYYLQKQKYNLLKIWELKEEEVKKKFKNKFIDYHDKRIPEVLKGYISQAIFFNLSGRPFCENKTCRLFNAHWQEDLIRAQIKSGEFCILHRKNIDRIKHAQALTC